MARDPHSFAPSDPSIALPRKLLVELLERSEMLADLTHSRTGKVDRWGKRVNDELTKALSR